jgi:probable HAF family extracellular repeat protein
MRSIAEIGVAVRRGRRRWVGMRGGRGWLGTAAVVFVSVLSFDAPASAADGSSTIVRLVDLGTLGGDYSEARAMNANGDIVGASNTTLPDDVHAVLWRDGRLIDLGAAGSFGTAATAVNNRGQVVGCVSGGGAFLWHEGRLTTLTGAGCAIAINDGSQIAGYRRTPTGGWRAFIWHNGAMTELGTLGGLDSFATGINDRGQVVGLLANRDQTVRRTFIWQNGFMTDLGTLGGPTSTPSGINNRGQIIGTSDVDSEGTLHPFLWQRGRLTDILDHNGGKNGWAADLNDSGDVVGAVDQRPFVWRRGTLIDLGTPGRGGYASAINDRGHVAAVNTAPYTNDDRPFLWRGGQGLVYLGTLGGLYTSTVGIDAHDRVAGNSSTPTNESHAVVWIVS